jgi:hypothetical protein
MVGELDVILNAIEDKTESAAEAMDGTLDESVVQLKNSFGELLETIEGAGIASFIQGVADQVNSWMKQGTISARRCPVKAVMKRVGSGARFITSPRSESRNAPSKPECNISRIATTIRRQSKRVFRKSSPHFLSRPPLSRLCRMAADWLLRQQQQLVDMTGKGARAQAQDRAEIELRRCPSAGIDAVRTKAGIIYDLTNARKLGTKTTNEAKTQYDELSKSLN